MAGGGGAAPGMVKIVTTLAAAAPTALAGTGEGAGEGAGLAPVVHADDVVGLCGATAFPVVDADQVGARRGTLLRPCGVLVADDAAEIGRHRKTARSSVPPLSTVPLQVVDLVAVGVHDMQIELADRHPMTG